jgi:hypothetical protein
LVGSKGAEALCAALCNNRHVHACNFNDNQLYDVGAEAVAALLMNTKSITTIGLSGNHITMRGTNAIARALMSNTTLTGLDMGNNNLGNPGIITMSAVIKKCNTTLMSLDVHLNDISDEGMRVFTDALLSNSTLRHVDVGSNYSRNQGAFCWAKVIRKCTNLTRICLTDNEIGIEGGEALLSSIRSNATLKNFQFGGQSQIHPLANKIHPGTRRAINNVIKRNKHRIEQRGNRETCRSPFLGTDDDNMPDGQNPTIRNDESPLENDEFGGEVACFQLQDKSDDEKSASFQHDDNIPRHSSTGADFGGQTPADSLGYLSPENRTPASSSVTSAGLQLSPMFFSQPSPFVSEMPDAGNSNENENVETSSHCQTITTTTVPPIHSPMISQQPSSVNHNHNNSAPKLPPAPPVLRIFLSTQDKTICRSSHVVQSGKLLPPPPPTPPGRGSSALITPPATPPADVPIHWRSFIIPNLQSFHQGGSSFFLPTPAPPFASSADAGQQLNNNNNTHHMSCFAHFGSNNTTKTKQQFLAASSGDNIIAATITATHASDRPPETQFVSPISKPSSLRPNAPPFIPKTLLHQNVRVLQLPQPPQPALLAVQYSGLKLGVIVQPKIATTTEFPVRRTQQQQQKQKTFNTYFRTQSATVTSLARSLCPSSNELGAPPPPGSTGLRHHSFPKTAKARANDEHLHISCNGQLRSGSPRFEKTQKERSIFRSPKLFKIPDSAKTAAAATLCSSSSARSAAKNTININICFPSPPPVFSPPETPQGELSSATINTVLSALQTLYTAASTTPNNTDTK